jgi:hypothetical protein
MNNLMEQPAPAVTRPDGPGTRWGRRHVKGVAVTRLLVAVWLVILGSVFCAYGQWWGALLFPVAVLHCWLAYRGLRSERARGAGQHVPQPR